jgi:hypothetical protein
VAVNTKNRIFWKKFSILYFAPENAETELSKKPEDFVGAAAPTDQTCLAEGKICLFPFDSLSSRAQPNGLRAGFVCQEACLVLRTSYGVKKGPHR